MRIRFQVKVKVGETCGRVSGPILYGRRLAVVSYFGRSTSRYKDDLGDHGVVRTKRESQWKGVKTRKTEGRVSE